MRMRSLDIETYNRLEIEGRIGLSVRALQIGAPVTFEFGGYPHRIHQEAEIPAYIDVFGGGIFGEILRTFYKDDFPLSYDEAELVRKISDSVVELTTERYGRGIRPWVGPLSYIILFRAISYIAERMGRRLTIFEVGPGAGYLGALLALSGHRYVATDIAQNMYLWQNRLYGKIAAGAFQELAFGDPAKPIEIDPRCQIVHVPWWAYAAFYKHTAPFRTDVLVSEKNLGEMAQEALDYTFAVARELLAGPKGVIGTRRGEGLFLFTNVGWGHVSQRSGIGASAARMGFKPLLSDQIHILVHGDSNLGARAVGDRLVDSDLPRPPAAERHPLQNFDYRVHMYDPSGRGGAARVIDYLPLRWSEAPMGYEWLRYMDRISDIAIKD